QEKSRESRLFFWVFSVRTDSGSRGNAFERARFERPDQMFAQTSHSAIISAPNLRTKGSEFQRTGPPFGRVDRCGSRAGRFSRTRVRRDWLAKRRLESRANTLPAPAIIQSFPRPLGLGCTAGVLRADRIVDGPGMNGIDFVAPFVADLDLAVRSWVRRDY